MVLEHGQPLRAMRLLPREGGLTGVVEHQQAVEIYELRPGSYRMTCPKGGTCF